MNDIRYYNKLTELLESGQDFVQITQVSSKGHVPACNGAKALITLQGVFFGTVGGGRVEARAIELAQGMIQDRKSGDYKDADTAKGTDASNNSNAAREHDTTKKKREPLSKHEPLLIKWNLTRDIGMTCGGEVEFLFEPHLTPVWTIALFGAGHVGQALLQLLAHLDCQIYCYDPRPEWTQKISAHSRLKIFSESPQALVTHLKTQGIDPQFVVMTQGHATDIPVLQAIAHDFAHPRFIGVIGSTVKGIKLRSQLTELGLPPEWIEQIKTPIGLSLGNNQVFEIAISIVAQLILERDKV